ncbi:hypothetical protein J2Y48_000992 [Mycoplana sp. BE70]|nr:hypothetical protein [Mycoplana sp. BE70]
MGAPTHRGQGSDGTDRPAFCGQKPLLLSNPTLPTGKVLLLAMPALSARLDVAPIRSSAPSLPIAIAEAVGRYGFRLAAPA